MPGRLPWPDRVQQPDSTTDPVDPDLMNDRSNVFRKATCTFSRPRRLNLLRLLLRSPEQLDIGSSPHPRGTRGPGDEAGSK